MLLDRNERRIMEQFGQRHRLLLTSLLLEDFANYSCYAENELGKARQFILLSGTVMGRTRNCTLPEIAICRKSYIL
jgi:hypothetical protein